MDKKVRNKSEKEEDFTDFGENFDDLIEFEEITNYTVDENGIFQSLTNKRKHSTSKSDPETQNKKFKVQTDLNVSSPKKKEEKKDKMKKNRKKKLSTKKIKQTKPIDETDLPKDEQIAKLNNKDGNDLAKKGEQITKLNNKDDKLPLKMEGMNEWEGLFVPHQILQCLKELNFKHPTPIQALVLPSAVRDKMDIIGAAETGSGKTLAFAIPIITHIINLKSDFEENVVEENEDETNNNHVSDDLQKAKFIEENSVNEKHDGEDIDDSNIGDAINNETSLVPEIGEQNCKTNEADDDEKDNDEDDEINDKEDDEEDDVTKDIKNKEVHKFSSDKPMYALIITPTRELAIQIKDHIMNIVKYTGIKCISIVGGMSVEKQNRLLKRSPEIVVATPGRLWELIQQKCPHVSHVADLRYLVIDEADRMMERNHFEELQQILNFIRKHSCTPLRRQNFVFSATLTFIHKKPFRFDAKKKKKMKELTLEDKLGALCSKLNMSGKPKIVDLTRGKDMMAQKLSELRIDCAYQEKDFYLYYFIKKHPGRTLVFANSKDCIRRLMSLFTMLNCNPLPLHADMHQRQRLKNLDRFKSNERGLLLATDVAARGLDIPNVKHVIHYQVPRTAENYVHRSGRTARSNLEGLSLILISPDENKLFHSIHASLKREKDLDKFEVDMNFFKTVCHIVSVARNVETEEHRINKEKLKKDWIEQACLEADLIDEEEMERKKKSIHLDDEALLNSKKKMKIDLLKQELNHLLGLQPRNKKKKTRKNKV